MFWYVGGNVEYARVCLGLSGYFGYVRAWMLGYFGVYWGVVGRVSQICQIAFYPTLELEYCVVRCKWLNKKEIRI